MAEIETLLLANHAEAVNGLLYMHGAGWTHHYRSFGANGEPAAALIGIGLTVLLKENEWGRPAFCGRRSP